MSDPCGLLFQRWNRLSRLQRSIVYALILVGATILVLIYISKNAKQDVHKKKLSVIAQVSFPEAIN